MQRPAYAAEAQHVAQHLLSSGTLRPSMMDASAEASRWAEDDLLPHGGGNSSSAPPAAISVLSESEAGGGAHTSANAGSSVQGAAPVASPNAAIERHRAAASAHSQRSGSASHSPKNAALKSHKLPGSSGQRGGRTTSPVVDKLDELTALVSGGGGGGGVAAQPLSVHTAASPAASTFRINSSFTLGSPAAGAPEPAGGDASDSLFSSQLPASTSADDDFDAPGSAAAALLEMRSRFGRIFHSPHTMAALPPPAARSPVRGRAVDSGEREGTGDTLASLAASMHHASTNSLREVRVNRHIPSERLAYTHSGQHRAPSRSGTRAAASSLPGPSASPSPSPSLLSARTASPEERLRERMDARAAEMEAALVTTQGSSVHTRLLPSPFIARYVSPEDNDAMRSIEAYYDWRARHARHAAASASSR
ncbi:MAG: hypothetical protein EOO41_01335 [Methanobacteriota archaeon]|nr:MAG: hypothetical protein EOO41_01335 [Euryarchaeota archaeon]